MFAGHGNVISDVAFSPDGKLIASGSYDGTVRLWDIATGKARATLKGHATGVFSVGFSPDGKIVASGAAEKFSMSGKGAPAEVKFWDAATGRELATLPVPGRRVDSVMFSHDGKTIMTYSTEGGGVILWDVLTK